MLTYADNLAYADVCWRMLCLRRFVLALQLSDLYGLVANFHRLCLHSLRVSSRMLMYADVCWRMLTVSRTSIVFACTHYVLALVCWRMLTYADVVANLHRLCLHLLRVSWRMLTYADVCTYCVLALATSACIYISSTSIHLYVRVFRRYVCPLPLLCVYIYYILYIT
jgi:hypothetical protein